MTLIVPNFSSLVRFNNSKKGKKEQIEAKEMEPAKLGLFFSSCCFLKQLAQASGEVPQSFSICSSCFLWPFELDREQEEMDIVCWDFLMIRFVRV
jgi:hypothetical protein